MQIEQNEAQPQTTYVEAFGVKGMKSKPFRKAFKSTEQMIDWADRNDAQIEGTRDLTEAEYRSRGRF